ncbi:galactosyl transferase GMA12/MNN10 family-domain-containing protein [Bisporella sp. PMI_857]|nr:galactosyl transferase GMA12/MNN10 family-domain-containing protein [Bisporella sp. PMI_857]
MHLALPTRKSSNPPLYAARSSRLQFPMIRRSRAKTILIGVCAFSAFLFLLSQIFGGAESIPPGTPPVVLVTVLDGEALYSKEYIQDIKENRIEYAKKHGYATFFPTENDYELSGSPVSWSKIPALRHALTKFPHSTYFWFLHQNALIMNPFIKVETDIMDPKVLESNMIKDQSIVPPDSVIKTFAHLKGSVIDFVLTQDKDGLAPGSFIIRRGDWAKFFLDSWFDPLYRSYNFQKADTHALEHIVQWHPTILSKLALIPQRIMNAYGEEGSADESGRYKAGDFVIRFAGCEPAKASTSCEAEAALYSKQWRTIFNA